MAARNKAFTIIELIVVITIISIIALASSGIIILFMQNAIYLPSQVNVQQVADEAIDIIIEGDGNANGLRFALRVTELGGNRVNFISANGDAIRFEIVNGVIVRSINQAAEEVIPYHTTGDITISGKGGVLFRYFDANENSTTIPSAVRRIQVDLLAQSGAGNISNWEGSITLGSSIKLYNLNQNPVIVNLRATRILWFRLWLVSFWVNDPDGGEVAWSAIVTDDPGGSSRLTNSSGSGEAGYFVFVLYMPSSGYNGAATITINLDDGDGGVISDSIDIDV